MESLFHLGSRFTSSLSATLLSSSSPLSLTQQHASITPYLFPPIPVFPPPFLPADSPITLYSFLQQNLITPDAFSSLSSIVQSNFIKCAICLAGFPNLQLLQQHAMLQHNGETVRRQAPEPREEKPFQCDQCGQSYRYRSAYLKHREQNHRARLPADKLFTCDVCGMQFRYLKSFKKHRLNHTIDGLQPRRGQRASESPVQASESQVSSTNEVEPPRDDSSDTLALTLSSSEPALLNLLRSPSERRERQTFICTFCSKSVRSKENLKLHVRKHTGERPFACLFCGRAFGGKSDLTRHVRIHTGERPYHCAVCGKCFARADYLSKHLTTHAHNSHPKITSD